MEALEPAAAAVLQERAGLDEPGVRGKIYYAAYCAVCHGETAAGDGFNADNLDPRPPDLRAVMAAHEDSLVARVMREGSGSAGKSPLCPPYGRTLDHAARGFILVYLKEGIPEAGSAP